MIKKLFVGLLAAVTLTACNDEKEDVISSVLFPTMNLVNPVNTGKGETPLIAESMYTFRINYTQLTGDITMSELNVNGITYGFSSPAMRVSEDNTYFTVKASEIPLTNGGGVVSNFQASMSSFAAFMPPQGVIGSPDFKGQNIIVANYFIDTPTNDYIVQTFPIDCVYTGITTPRINDQVTETTKDILYRVYIDPKSLKADIYVYNGKFSPNQPVTVNFVLKGLELKADWRSYSIEGKDVVPLLLGEDTPYPKFTFKDFKLQTDPDNLSRVKINFTIPMGENTTYNAVFDGINRVTQGQLN